MFKYIIEKAGELDWLAVGPLLLFFAVFVGFTIWILTKSRSYIDRMSRLPLEEDNKH